MFEALERDSIFFSFEFYPFDNICADAAPQLREIPSRLGSMLASLRADGVPSDIRG